VPGGALVGGIRRAVAVVAGWGFPVPFSVNESECGRGPAPLYSVPLFMGIGYNVLVLNARDQPDCASATTANLDIDIEHTFQSLSPCHRYMHLGG
jgi:hypothetical protein